MIGEVILSQPSQPSWMGNSVVFCRCMLCCHSCIYSELALGSFRSVPVHPGNHFADPR